MGRIPPFFRKVSFSLWRLPPALAALHPTEVQLKMEEVSFGWRKASNVAQQSGRIEAGSMLTEMAQYSDGRQAVNLCAKLLQSKPI